MINTNATLSVSLSFPNDGTRYSPTLEITDRVSGTRVAEIKFDAESFVDLLGGRHVGEIEGWLLPEKFRHRLGCRMEHEQREVPTEVAANVFDVMSVNKDSGYARARLQAWAEEVMAAEGWESWDERRTNHGLYVVFRRYVPVEQTEAAEVTS